MEFLELLENARTAELEVAAEIEMIERLHRIMRLTGHSKNYAVKLVEELAALEKEANDRIDRLAGAKGEALKVLSFLSGEKRAVLYRYYILAKDWRKISEEMFISERQVFNIRKKALETLDEHYNRKALNRREAV